MSPLNAAFTLTPIAFLTGVALVLLSIQYRHLGATTDNRPLMSSDDMGTSGLGFPSDARPSATSSIR